MLKACAVYPWELKQRIMSRTGHLSNDDIAAWLADTGEGFDGVASHVVLTHLSQRANNPYVARICAEEALRTRGSLLAPQTEIILSHPKEPTKWIEL
jgi:phosphoribosyl 1,2-cyclic phosphodiesterase